MFAIVGFFQFPIFNYSVYFLLNVQRQIENNSSPPLQPSWQQQNQLASNLKPFSSISIEKKITRNKPSNTINCCAAPLVGKCNIFIVMNSIDAAFLQTNCVIALLFFVASLFINR